jgi:hypothetical protein
MSQHRYKRSKIGEGRAAFNSFFDGYVTAALWSSTDNADESGGEPLDKNYDRGDIAEKSLAKMKRDCIAFMRKNKSDLGDFVSENPRGSEGDPWALAGHCFWLNRNGHGTGFWDRGVNEKLGQRLSAASEKARSSDIYVGDDGKLHVS